MSEYMGRTIDDAIKAARKREGDLPHIVQVLPSDYDTIIMADRIETLTVENERLRERLTAYTEYCGICHGRGSIIEEDHTTGADLWRDCPGCTPARAALSGKAEQ